MVTRGHSWSFVVTRGHSWSLVVIRGHSYVLLDKIVLNCNYLGGYSMKLFETRVYCSNFFPLCFESFRLNGHAEKK